MTESTERRHGSQGTSAYRNVTLFNLNVLLGTFSLPFHSALNTLDKLLEIKILPVADHPKLSICLFQKTSTVFCGNPSISDATLDNVAQTSRVFETQRPCKVQRRGFSHLATSPYACSSQS